MSAELDREIRRRRTFAIISHPDAGKTTMTEKLLLFGGAIQLAGAVKAKKSQQSARSDWSLAPPAQRRGSSSAGSGRGPRAGRLPAKAEADIGRRGGKG